MKHLLTFVALVALGGGVTVAQYSPPSGGSGSGCTPAAGTLCANAFSGIQMTGIELDGPGPGVSGGLISMPATLFAGQSGITFLTLVGHSFTSLPTTLLNPLTGLQDLVIVQTSLVTPPVLTLNTSLQNVTIIGNSDLTSFPDLTTTVNLTSVSGDGNALTATSRLVTNVMLTDVDFSTNTLPASQVNQVLADLVTCCLMNAGTVDLSGGTNAAPTTGPPDGIAAAAALVGAGWTVTTN